jgi:CrcB protein
VINLVIAVFVGGALGATVREYIMLMVQDPVDGFPLDILAANLVAAFLLGLVAALHSRRIVSDDINALVGTGIMGGLSTFSSFVYGAVVLMAARRTEATMNDPVSCRDCCARSSLITVNSTDRSFSVAARRVKPTRRV